MSDVSTAAVRVIGERLLSTSVRDASALDLVGYGRAEPKRVGVTEARSRGTAGNDGGGFIEA